MWGKSVKKEHGNIETVIVMSSADILKESGVAEILITLLENPESNQTELEEKSGLSNWKILKLVPRLIDKGLIIERRGAYNQKILKLTTKGEDVAKALKRAREVFEKEN